MTDAKNSSGPAQTRRPGRAACLAVAGLLLSFAAGCGGARCDKPTFYARSVDGPQLQVPDSLSPPESSGQFEIPPSDPSAPPPSNCIGAPPKLLVEATAPPPADAAPARDLEPPSNATPPSNAPPSADPAPIVTAAAPVAGPPPVSTSAPSGTPPPAAPAAGPVDDQRFEEVREMVTGWATAWAERDLDAYLGYYSANFQPPGELSFTDWVAARRQRMEEGAEAVVIIDTLEVGGQGSSAVAAFEQRFEYGGLASEVRKSLVLAREGSDWRILEERVVEVF